MRRPVPHGSESGPITQYSVSKAFRPQVSDVRVGLKKRNFFVPDAHGLE